MYVITSTERQELKHSRLGFHVRKLAFMCSPRGPALLPDRLASSWSRCTSVFLSTVFGPILDQDFRACALISAGPLALEFANPFSPWASSFYCCSFFFFIFPPASSRAWIWPKKWRGVSSISHADVLGWSRWRACALCELRELLRD